MDAIKEIIVTKGFLVSSLAETVDEANKIFQIVQIVLAIFGTIALIVSAIGMANASVFPLPVLACAVPNSDLPI